MSENLDLVRSIYTDLESGFVFQAASERTHPEFEMIVADGPRAGSFKGVAGAEESFYGMLEAWDEWRFDAEEYRELDDERVLVLDHRRGRGKGSGVKVETKAAAVYHIRDGKLTRIIIYWDRDRALADLGLEEYAVPEESTTPDLADRAERMVEAFNAGDFDLWASFYAPDALFYPRAAVGVLEGREAIRSFIEDWHGMYEDFIFELKEFRDLGNGVTFSVISQRGRLADTTAWVPEERSALVFTWANGLIEKETNFTDPDEGRSAAERLAQEQGVGRVS